MATRPFKDAHFAVFPPDLIEPMVLAGCPEKVCVECETPYQRKTEAVSVPNLESSEDITYKPSKKPYAVVEKEHRKSIIEYRDLPNHDELRTYLKKYRSKSGITIDAIEEHFGTQAPHHWFEKGGSYPDKDDWIQLKKLLSLDDTYDKVMTEIFEKSGYKGETEYVDKGLQKQCQCETNEVRKGIVLDCFMGSGTTGMVAQSLGRSWIGCELNPEYVEMQKKRTSQQSLF